MRAGKLRSRITIRRSAEVKNERGGYDETWADLGTIFAEVTGLDGRESVMDKVLQGISVYRVTIRWRDDLKASDQLRSAGGCFGGRDVNIRSAVDPTGRREELVIIADTASVRTA